MTVEDGCFVLQTRPDNKMKHILQIIVKIQMAKNSPGIHPVLHCNTGHSEEMVIEHFQIITGEITHFCLYNNNMLYMYSMYM